MTQRPRGISPSSYRFPETRVFCGGRSIRPVLSFAFIFSARRGLRRDRSCVESRNGQIDMPIPLMMYRQFPPSTAGLSILALRFMVLLTLVRGAQSKQTRIGCLSLSKKIPVAENNPKSQAKKNPASLSIHEMRDDTRRQVPPCVHGRLEFSGSGKFDARPTLSDASCSVWQTKMEPRRSWLAGWLGGAVHT